MKCGPGNEVTSLNLFCTSIISLLYEAIVNNQTVNSYFDSHAIKK